MKFIRQQEEDPLISGVDSEGGDTEVVAVCDKEGKTEEECGCNHLLMGSIECDRRITRQLLFICPSY